MIGKTSFQASVSNFKVFGSAVEELLAKEVQTLSLVLCVHGQVVTQLASNMVATIEIYKNMFMAITFTLLSLST